MIETIPCKIIKEADGDVATVYLYGFIGQAPGMYDDTRKDEDITDIAFLKTMQDLEKRGVQRVNVRINSPGGSMLHMDGIISLMQSSKMEVHTWVDGMAASAAADIFLAAKKDCRHMAKNGKLMIHTPMNGVYGPAKKMRQMADTLDKFESGAIAQMANDTGMAEEEIKSRFYDGEDHWMTAKEAFEMGLTAGVENYNAETPPVIETQKQNDVVKLFKQLFTAAFPEKSVQVAEPVQILEEMNIENLKTSVTNGEIALADVTKFLQEQGYTVEKAAAAPAADPAPAVDVAKVVEDAVAPLKALIDSMQKKLDTTPGAGPAVPMANADPAGDPDADEEELMKISKSHAEAAKTWSNPFSHI